MKKNRPALSYMPDPPRATMRHPRVRRITVFGADNKPLYTFKPERVEELTVVIETSPDEAPGRDEKQGGS